jgi:hypothetical protein
MAGMKISLDAAMRARDISQPTPAQETAAERADEAQPRTTPTPAPTRPRLRPTLPGVGVREKKAEVVTVADADRKGTDSPRRGTVRASEATGPDDAQILPSLPPASTPDRQLPGRRRMRRRPRDSRGEP